MSTLARRLRNLPGALALLLEAWLRLGLARYAILQRAGLPQLAATLGRAHVRNPAPTAG
jgi:hypothetical protein